MVGSSIQMKNIYRSLKKRKVKRNLKLENSFQSLPIDDIIVVTSPSELSSLIISKAEYGK
jgi:hypothetical protein